MGLNDFKDKLFDLLNESDNMEIKDIKANDKENIFKIFLEDGYLFEIECRQISSPKKPIKNQIYITEEEKENCQKVADAFAELYECSDIVVVNAGKYGFAKLQYYTYPDCFERVALYTDSQELFQVLWEDWLDVQLLKLTKNTPMEDIELENVFQCMPQEKQKELLEKQIYFAEKTGIKDILLKNENEINL